MQSNPQDRLSPPGPRARFPGHTLLQFARRRLPFLVESAKQYGDIVFFKVGNERIYLFNHPDLIRDVLVTNQKNFTKSRALVRAKRLLGEGLLTSEGEFHLRQRRLAQPAFHRDRIAAYGLSMVEFAKRTRSRWSDGAALDVHDDMMKLTLAIVAKTLFSADVEKEATEIGEALTTAFEAFNIGILPFSELLEKLPLPYLKRFEAARTRLDATLYRIIDERRATGADTGDLLSMLLLAQDTEGDGGGMTDTQVRDEAMTTFLAGHETTANALAWAVGRRAINDFEAGGYQIPARSMVLMSQYIMHRDPRFHPDPERFAPERWRPEAAAARPRFSYFPFGGGTRVCIGEQFAWMEGILILATIAQKWRLRYLGGGSPMIEPRITLRPAGGIAMRAESR